MLRVFASVPAELRDELEALARENDRSVSAEIRRALVAHLSAGNGASAAVDQVREQAERDRGGVS
ncbi:MAG TPA: ribbon-helix-helix protein, CopG family [Gaiellaceae bacterium]|nr:ribbon-helix-helix protein, CopG family [Gaiellaceae bacterium]